ncbi:MAG: TetR/AcrR family transcriptional regulator [Hyphomicrobiaceae bacterium]
MGRLAKREDLIDAAIRLFNRNGYRATGVDRLMEETGIAKTTLYRHFKSKEELIIAALKKVDDAARDDMRAYVEAASDDPRERVLATFGLLDIWLRQSDFKGCPFVAAASEFGEHTDPVFQQVRLHKRLYLALFEELVRAARIREPARVARQLVMLHEGAVAFAQVMGPDGVADEARRAAESLIGPPRDG